MPIFARGRATMHACGGAHAWAGARVVHMHACALALRLSDLNRPAPAHARAHLHAHAILHKSSTLVCSATHG
eukprot:13268377-Alexandrium_andersonii.AAC.1